MSYENSLKDKTIIVTGANCGIGYQAALDFAKRGARVILGCRNRSRADEACKAIIYESGNQNVEVELLDLSSLKSTRDFAQRMLLKLERLDILVNNAGLVSYTPYETTEDGIETHFAVNYLSHYLLTRLLLDLLKKSAPSRIINVSSKAHEIKKMNWDDLNYEKSYSAFDCYGQSKLAQVLFTIELEKRLKNTGVCAVSLHPGIVDTEIFRKRDNQGCFMSFITCFFWPCLKCCGKSSADGAKTTIHCATSPDVPSQSGSYFDESKVKMPTIDPFDLQSTEKLWNISAKLVGII